MGSFKRSLWLCWRKESRLFIRWRGQTNGVGVWGWMLFEGMGTALTKGETRRSNPCTFSCFPYEVKVSNRNLAQCGIHQKLRPTYCIGARSTGPQRKKILECSSYSTGANTERQAQKDDQKVKSFINATGVVFKETPPRRLSGSLLPLVVYLRPQRRAKGLLRHSPLVSFILSIPWILRPWVRIHPMVGMHHCKMRSILQVSLAVPGPFECQSAHPHLSSYHP